MVGHNVDMSDELDFDNDVVLAELADARQQCVNRHRNDD